MNANERELILKKEVVNEWIDKAEEDFYAAISLRSDMVRLSVYAVEFRYPGESATVDDAKATIDIMKRARAELRNIFTWHRHEIVVIP